MQSSRFTYGAWLILLLVALVAFLCLGIGISFREKAAVAPFGAFLFIVFFAFVETWLFWGEFRAKAIRVQMDDFHITIRRFGGLGRETAYDWKLMDGFQTAILPAEHGTYEYLYLLQNGKKIVKLSEFYHRNYRELKAFIQLHVADKGIERFSYWRELKEIFQ